MAVISLKCPNCDGELIFDPSSGKYKCEYCFSLFSQEELDAMQPAAAPEQSETKQSDAGQEDAGGQDVSKASDAESRKEASGQEAVIYTCPSCGAQIVTDETTAATFCYYCHNPVVLGGRVSGEFLPDKIIPFEIDRKEAEKKFLDYVGKKKFVPRFFFQKKQIEKMTGVYFPYWLYDVSLEGNLEAEAKKTRVWISGEEEYTETKIYSIEREGTVDLNHLAMDALQKANKTLIEGVLPYQFDKMKDFTIGYLSGFQAEKRDIERENYKAQAEQEMQGYAKNLMRESVDGYGSVTVKNSHFHTKHELWNYVLLPVWTVTYRAKNGKIFYYSMNGQTGKVCGELPIDYKKLGLLSGIVSAVVLVLALIGGFLL